MATGGYTKKNTNFCRSNRFLLDVGTPVLIKLMENKALSYPGITTVDAFFQMSSTRRTLNQLTPRVIRKEQLNMIYPLNGASPDTQQWDITLISVVLKNTCNLTSNEEQLLDNLRTLRNSIYGHMSSASMEDGDFENTWNDIESIIINILTILNCTDFTETTKAAINKIKNDPLDIEPTLRALREMYERQVSDGQNSIVDKQDQIIDTMKVNQDEIVDIMKENQDEIVDTMKEIKGIIDGVAQGVENNQKTSKVPDEEYRSTLQKYLIDRYERDRSILSSVCPLIKDTKVEVADIYTPVQLYDVTRQHSVSFPSSSNGHEQNEDIETYYDIFHNKESDELITEIILTAAAGRGKTTFCLRLINDWCSAMKKRNSDRQQLTENDKQMQEFDFLFFVSLRRVPERGTVFEMIRHQLLQDLSDEFIKFVQDCFVKTPHRCLILLDGLDEWNPRNCETWGNDRLGQRWLNNCPTVITTRPWKLDSLHMNSKQRILKIGELNKESIRTLAYKLLSNFYKESNDKVEDDVKNFMDELKRKRLSLLAEIPLVLTYLLCLWKEKNGFEDSLTQIFGGLVNSLLKAGVHHGSDSNACDSAGGNTCIPRSLSSWNYLVQFGALLLKLGSFAFDCLICSSEIVYDRRVLEGLLGYEEFDLSLKIGMLSKSIVPGSIVKDRFKVQFFNQHIQEFLAALWITSSEYGNGIDKVQTLEKVLAMSNVVIFSCGMKPAQRTNVSKHIMKLSSFSDVQTYRHSLDGKFNSYGNQGSTYSIVKRLQNMMQRSFKESQLNYRKGGIGAVNNVHQGVLFFNSPDFSFHIDDIILTENAKEEIMELALQNGKQLKSLFIENHSAENKEKLIDKATSILNKVTSLERLHMGIYSDVLYSLKSWQLKHLYSLTVCLEKPKCIPVQFSQLQNLSALSLTISADHATVKQLSKYFCKTSLLQEIELLQINCLNYRESLSHECKYSIDLSKNHRLRRLRVDNVTASEIEVNSINVECVSISGKTNSPSTLFIKFHLFRCLTHLILGEHHAFGAFKWTRNDIKILVDVIPNLHSLEALQFLGIDFGDLAPKLSPRSKLTSLYLDMVTMRKDSWNKFIQSLKDTGKNVSTTEIDEDPVVISKRILP